MSSPTAHRDASLSAASFLASISAESSTSFGSTASGSSAATSAPALPISAKVSLIDAQIDALEGRIEQTITSHAAQLRERAASTRSVDRDLNQLWRSIHQTSSRLVTIGPQLSQISSDYHDALAQNSKQRLLISVLSDLLAATRLLERLEKLQLQSDLLTLRDELPKASEVMQPLRSRSALQNLPAVVELRARFERLENKCKEAESASRRVDAPQTTKQEPGRANMDASAKDLKGTTNTSSEQVLSPALKLLDTARALIVSQGSEGGWKQVRIELDAPAAPPPAVLPATGLAAQLRIDSSRSSLDSHPERLHREDLMPESASLTRNSSSSSTANARNRHKPKLGARLIRPQDQLGSGPFNAEDIVLDEDGWGLDDDDEETTLPQPAAHSGNTIPPSQSIECTSQPAHLSVSSLTRHSQHSSPSSSVVMQSSMSSSSSQLSAFAVQEPELRADASASNDVDAWGLGEEDDDAGDDAWGLHEDDVPQQIPPTPKKVEAHVSAPVERTEAPATPAGPAAHDAWALEDDDIIADEDPWETEGQSGKATAPPAALEQHDAAQLASSSVHELAVAPTLLSGEVHADHAEPSHLEPPSATTNVESDPWEADDQPARVAAPLIATRTHNDIPHKAADVPPPGLTGRQDSSLAEKDSLSATAMDKPSHDAMELAQQAPHTEALSFESDKIEEGTQPVDLMDETRPQTQRMESAPQSVTEDEMDEEPAEDAWGFEEGSSASEADRVEFAPITHLSKKDESDRACGHTQPCLVGSTKVEASKAHVEATAASAVEHIAEPQTGQFEPVANPPSPTGWGQDFSDSESAGVPAIVDHIEAARSSTRTVSAISPAHSGTRTRDVPKLSDATPEPCTAVKEKCTISQRSLDLINLAENTMSSVISLLRGQGESVAGDDDVEAVAGAILKIFELHRALMPVAHGEALQEVPSLAMQFFNDCEYLARELSRLVGDKGEEVTTAWLARDAEAAKRWRTEEMIKLEQEATLTRGLGQRWFEAQMTAQTKVLLDTLMEADGFARTFDEHRFGRCERCIKQVVQTLEQLGKAWQPVLVTSRFHAAIGRLVDLVFQKVLHDVLDLEDIGESESEKIASLVKTLGSLESLFASEDSEQSAAALWVPSWFKTSYLIEILTGSLVDIEFLAFEAGALVDYSRKELTGLIKALFADTPNRSKLLRRIETAPVDVLAH